MTNEERIWEKLTDVGEAVKALRGRQEALITAMNGMVDEMETQQATLGELMKWLQEPTPTSNDLPEALRTLAVRVGEQSTAIYALEKTITTLVEHSA